MKPDHRRLWTVVPLTLAVAPLFLHLPLWVGILWACCAFLHLTGRAAARYKLWSPVLAVVVLAGVLAEFRSVIGPQAGVTLLVGMTAAKLLESSTARDQAVLAFIGYFMLLTHFIHGQEMLLAVYLGLTAIALTAALMASQPTAPIKARDHLRLAAVMLSQALPLALLLFILFPRLPTPFGGLAQTQTGQTGLSDTMQPGSVSELIQSDAVAFRAEFEGSAPNPSDLYWRGPVLWAFDGRIWRAPGDLTLRPIQSKADGRRIRYAVTLEPHQQRWLLTLGLPERPPDIPADATPDFQWLAKQPVTTRLRYTHSAFLDYRMDLDLAEGTRRSALQLPHDYNPRTRDLIEGWRVGNRLSDALSDEAIIDRALSLFRDEPFYYTLRPPRLGPHSVDDFLFESRRGFCEHYASAFVVMMRMAGLPARVVTGYQGAEFNPLGNYWLVRQRDAHAWAEVWLLNRGWIRVDPTAAVAPERVERGINAALPQLERSLTAWDMALLRPLHQAWDALNNQWHQWVIGYDHARQRSLLERLHPALASLKGMLWVMVAGGLGLLALLFISLFGLGRKSKPERIVRVFDRFKGRLRSMGLTTPPQEGPADLAARISKQQPNLASDVKLICALYAGLRYGKLGEKEMNALEKRVHRFSRQRDPR